MKTAFYLLALILVLGCGARKSETNVTTTDRNTELAATGEKTADLVQNSANEVTGQKEKTTVTETQSNSGKATPVNPDKPMEIIQDGNKTTIHNGTWETGSEKTKTETKEKETTHKKDTLATSIKQAEKQAVTLKEQEKTADLTKAVDKKQYNFLPAGITAAVILALILLFILKRRNDEKAKGKTA